MKLQLQVSEQTWEAYCDHADRIHGLTNQTVSPESLMADQLQRFAHVIPSDRIVVLEPASRARLEEILQGGGLADAKDLVAKVQNLASLEIGKVVVDFSPAQWEELRNLARRNAKTVQDVAEATVRGMESIFFNHLSGGNGNG